MSEIDQLLQKFPPRSVQNFDEWIAVTWDTTWVIGHAFLRLSGSSKHIYQLKFQSKPGNFRHFKTKFIETDDLDVLEFLLKIFCTKHALNPIHDKLPLFFDEIPELKKTSYRLTFDNAGKHAEHENITSVSIVGHILDMVPYIKGLPKKGVVASHLFAFLLRDEKGARLLTHPRLAETAAKKHAELSLEPDFISTTTSDKLIAMLGKLYD